MKKTQIRSRRRTLTVRRSSEPSRIAADCLMAAYEHILPLPRRPVVDRVIEGVGATPLVDPAPKKKVA
jgi:hypothetical protein